MEQQRTYPAGVTCWVDVEQRDVSAATEFYGAVFGWSFHEAAPPDAPVRYVIAQLGSRDVAGIGSPSTPDAPEQQDWLTYVAVDDVVAALDAVTAAGGSVTRGPTVVGEGGTWAGFTDPQGAGLRLWKPRRRLGAQAVNEPGSWNFSDLHTPDPAAAASFYGRAFGWTFSDLGFATMIGVPGYGDHLQATVDPGIHERQAGVSAPPGFADAIGWLVAGPGDEPAHWHVTFAVADRDEAARLAEAHGGSVVTSDDSRWAKTVTIRDPQGATFTASQFTPPG
jgi:uncharacterized protein